MRIIHAAGTDTGLVRENNEDSFLELEPLFAIADGMGGHLAGDVASSTAVASIREAADGGLIEAAELGRVIEEANSEIYAKAARDPGLSGMGTTCTLLLVADGKAHIAHVGDSRAYLFRGGKLRQLTEDHTLVNRMVREGRLRAEDAERHPQRSIVTRALGIEPAVDVDEMSLEIAEDDRILLCSDGLSGMVDSATIGQILGDNPDPSGATARLIERALEAGGEDNVTVIVVDVVPDEGAGSRPAREMTPVEDGRPAPPPPPEAEAEPDPARRGWSRRLGIGAAVVILLAGASYGATRWVLSNSYFVGVNDEGLVTIYRGIPEEIAGLELREVAEESRVALEELPESFRESVTEGIKTDSLEAARATLENLEDRSEDFGTSPQKPRN